MKNQTNRLRFVGLIAAFLLLSVGVLTGCPNGDEPDVFDGGGGSQDETDVGPDADTGDEDVEEEEDLCEDVECSDDEFCEQGECLESGQGLGCTDPIEVNLDEAGTTTVSGDPRGSSLEIPTNCDSTAGSPQSIFHFTVDVETRLTAEITDSDVLEPLVKELRINHCDDTAAEDFCSINPQNWIAEPGTDYYLIIRPGANGLIGEFDLSFEVEPLLCEPGERTCHNGDVSRCAGGDEEVIHECIDGCNDGECLGDTCANPIELSAGMSFSAEMASYHDTVNLSNSPECSSMGTDGPENDGQDIFFSLPGLTAGQTIEATSPGGFYLIGIMGDCTPTAPTCITGNNTGGALEWTVDVPGDYYVIFKRNSTSNESADFSIDITD